MSVPQSNSTHATESPSAETERSRRTPGEPLTADSTGKVTRSSTSSAAMPGASVITVTVGAERSGKMSTGRVAIKKAPATVRSAATVTTSHR